MFRQGADEGRLLGLALDPESRRTDSCTCITPLSGNTGVNRVFRYREAGRPAGEGRYCRWHPFRPLHAGDVCGLVQTGLLYVTIGDGGNRRAGRNLGTPRKVLRINPTEHRSARIRWLADLQLRPPPPEGIDWHPTTGDLWSSEHGATGNDEINALARRELRVGPHRRSASMRAWRGRPVTFYTPLSRHRARRFIGGSSSRVREQSVRRHAARLAPPAAHDRCGIAARHGAGITCSMALRSSRDGDLRARGLFTLHQQSWTAAAILRDRRPDSRLVPAP